MSERGGGTRAAFAGGGSKPPPGLITIVLLVLLAFALRVYRLDGQSLWSDEFISLQRANQPLAELVTKMPPEHAPLYFVVLHFWTAGTGTATDFGLRALSVVFSLLAVALAYRLGGLWTAFLLAVNPFQVWYAQEARMYAMVLALGLASVLGLLDLLGANDERPTTNDQRRTTNDERPTTNGHVGPGAWGLGLKTGDWRLRTGDWRLPSYVLVTAAMLYTHYYAFLLLAVEWAFVAWWVWRRDRAAWRPFAAAQLGVGLLFLPWVPRLAGLLGFPGWRPALDVASLPLRYLAIYTVGTSLPADTARWLSLGFLLLVGVGLVRQKAEGRGQKAEGRGQKAELALIACYLVVPLVAGALLALRKPDFHERYFIMLTPGLYLAMAAGAEALRRAWPPFGLAVVGFVLVASGWSLGHHYFDPAYARPDYRAMARYIYERGQPDDGVILNGPERAYLARYYPGPPPEQANLAGSRYRGKEDEALARLADMAARHSRLWLAVEFRGPDYIKEWLDRNGYQAGWFTTQDIALYLYSFPKQAGVVRRPDTIKQAGPVTLDGYRLTPDPVPAGRVAHLALHWRAETAVPADYKVALRVTDADGRVLVAIDRPPVDGFAPTSGWPPGQAVEDHYGLWLPADASPGRYPIQLKLYQESTWAEVLAATLGPLQVVKP
jgi:hypothetical protein